MGDAINPITAGVSEQLPRRLLTVSEVAELLNVHVNTVRQWNDKGLIKSYRLGTRRDRRFSPADINGVITTSGRRVRGTVLIVEDDPAVRTLLDDVVRQQGCIAISVESGDRALEELEKQRCDLVFLDLVLPGLNGLEVLRSIKDSEHKTAVAVITGHGDRPIALEAMLLGPMFFIRKPFNIADIVQVLEATIELRY